MAINVQHGSIASALGLAQKSGQAQRNRVVAAQDLAFLEQMQNAQAQADQNHAREIQTALGAQQSSNDLALAADRVNADHAFRQQQLNAQVADQNADRQLVAQKQQQHVQQTQAMQSYGQQYGTPQDQAFIAASGKLPETLQPQNPSASLTNDPRISALRMDLELAQKSLEQATRDKQALLRSSLQGADDPAYKQFSQVESQARAAVQAKADALRQQYTGMTTGKPVVSPAAVQQTIQTLAAEREQSGGILGTMSGAVRDQTSVPPGSQGVLSEGLARSFLNQANGDKNLARQMAVQAGYTIPS